MTQEEPKVTPRGKYTTTDTYKLLGISYNTLMKYTREGLIVSSNGKLGRFFYGENILKFWRAR